MLLRPNGDCSESFHFIIKKLNALEVQLDYSLGAVNLSFLHYYNDCLCYIGSFSAFGDLLAASFSDFNLDRNYNS